MAPTRSLPPDGDHHREALVVVDLQTHFFADPAMAPHRMRVVEAVNSLAASAREAGHLLVEVRTSHQPDGSTWTLAMQGDGSGGPTAGTSAAAPLPELDLEDAVVVSKTRDSAFFATELGELLARAQVGRIALAGVSTETCVFATAADAYARDVRVVLVGEAVASIDDERHARALEELRLQYRQPVRPVAEVVREWTPSARGSQRGRDVAHSS